MCIILNCQAQWRDARSTKPTTKSSPGENATAGQVRIDSYRECSAYLILASQHSPTPIPPMRLGRNPGETTSASTRNRRNPPSIITTTRSHGGGDILHHIRKGNSWITVGRSVETGKVFFKNTKNVNPSYRCRRL